jgi:hypothetical protein
VADAANPATPAQEAATPRPPLGVVLDADLGGRPDALLALALLNGLSARNEARRIALCVTRPSLVAAQLADVIAEYYSTLPANWGYATIGMPEGPAPVPDNLPLAAVLARKSLEGVPTYPTHVHRRVDTADSATLIRNLLLAEQDGNAVLVLAGAATGLSRLLDVYGTWAQLAAKVKLLVVAAGAYPGGNAEATIASDVRAARRLFEEWPTPIVAVGAELGEGLRLPAKVVAEMLAAAPAHPVAAAYVALGRMPYDTPTTALAALLYAVHPDSDDYRLSAPGTLSVLDDGRTRFTPHADGTRRYLIANPERAARLLEQYAALVSAPPAPRPIIQRKPPVPPIATGVAQPSAAAQPAELPTNTKPR